MHGARAAAAMTDDDGELARNGPFKRSPVKISRHRHDNPLRLVPRADIVKEILPPQRPDRRCPPKDRTAQRMTAHDLAGMEFLDKIFRIILHHADLFQHDLFFFFDVLGPNLERCKRSESSSRAFGRCWSRTFT